MTKRSSSFLKPTEQLLDKPALRRGIANHLHYTVGKDAEQVTDRDWFMALAHTIRDRLTERWMKTTRRYQEKDVKRVYYLSLEFLIGRSLNNSALNLGIAENFRQILTEFEMTESRIADTEAEAALGNGGLGRLAACFLDSLATLDLPGEGYGIRYEYGMFHQHLHQGWQREQPDNWLRYGNPWEFPRPEILYPVEFGGRVVEYRHENGQAAHQWTDTEHVMAMAYDMPIPGYDTDTVNNLRLWSAKSSRDFDLEFFNAGDYIRAVEHKNLSETLSKVLYPSDSTSLGRELRLKQEYFFISASLQDIVHKHVQHYHTIENLSHKIAIQLNDTHPALAIPELMRLLLDKFYLTWERAWELTVNTFSYTNHTLLPEALETWPVPLLERLLPRHLQIIYEINHRFLRDVAHRYPGDGERLRRMSLISEEGTKQVRMGHLAFVGSHRVNGVAQLHTQLMRDTTFADFEQFFPQRIVNKTNGITPRRWLNEANPPLTQLISDTLGHKHWLKDLTLLKQLIPFAEDNAFRQQFRAVKQHNKVQLAHFVQQRCGIILNPHSLFDVQIKRIHEYKRQLLNLLHVVTHYVRLRDNPHLDTVARTVIFAGKAAPGYAQAKLIIKLINDIADVVNHDPRIGDRLKVIFIPNYDVSTALKIIPAAELSQQISTAGTEASGTGNMKLALNGALTIGTLDGANIEIREEVGADNFFIFGMNAEEISALKRNAYSPLFYYHAQAELRMVLDMIAGGYFSPDAPDRFQPLIDALLSGGDYYCLLADYADYIRCQNEVTQLYRDSEEWTRRAILNTANMGKFSSDRTIKEYAQDIWKIGEI
jgi:glycogen phosphorylase